MPKTSIFSQIAPITHDIFLDLKKKMSGNRIVFLHEKLPKSRIFPQSAPIIQGSFLTLSRYFFNSSKTLHRCNFKCKIPKNVKIS